MTKLVDTPELRAKRLAAYEAGQYRFSAPPVPSRGWSKEDWMNYVRFNDPELTGFLPYSNKVTP